MSKQEDYRIESADEFFIKSNESDLDQPRNKNNAGNF
jgi:hypothetical protein